MSINTRNKLSLLFNIEAGEGQLVGLMLAYSFFVGFSRLLVSATASTLFGDRFGQEAAQMLPYVYIGAAIVAPLTGYLYSRLESRFSRRPAGFSLLMSANLSFLLIIIGSTYLLIVSFPQARWPAMALYIGYYVLYALIVLSFWSLATRLFDIRQSKRLFGLIGSGLAVAMVISGFSIRPLVNLIGAPNLLPVAGGGVIGCLILMLYITRARRPVRTAEQISREKQERPAPGKYSDLLKNRYIILMVALTVLNLLGYYFIDNAFYDRVYLRFSNPNELAGFLGEFLAISSLFNLFSRTFISGRLVSRHGILISLLTLPVVLAVGVISLATIGTIFGAIPLIFWLVVTTRLLFRGLGDSVDKAAFSILYQALPDQQRIRVQTLIISIIEPVAGGLAGLLLLLLSANAIQLSYVLIFILTGWIIAVILVNREYMGVLLQALTRSHLTKVPLSVLQGASTAILHQALKSPYPNVVIYALNMLEENHHESLPRFLREALSHPEPDVRLDALRRIERLGLTSTLRAVRLRLKFERSTPVHAAALRTLAALEPAEELDEILPYLEDTDPQLRLGAMVGLLRSGGIEGILMAGEKLLKHVNSTNITERGFAAQVLGEVGLPNFYRPLLKLLQDNDLGVRRTALTAAGKIKSPKLWPAVIENLAYPPLRRAVIAALAAGGHSTLPAIKMAFSQQRQTPENLVRLARLCGHICGPDMITLLEEQLDFPDNHVRHQVLISLSLCRYQAQDEQVTDIQQKIKAEIKEGTWILAVVADIDKKSPGRSGQEAITLLKRSLLHELAQSRARVFLLLSFIYPPEPILRVRDNLTHPSREKRAYALEFLDNLLSTEKLDSQALKGQDLKEMFFPLLDENLDPEQRLGRLQEHFPQTRLGQIQRLEEITNGSDRQFSPWIKACALNAMACLGARRAEPTVLAALSAANPLIRETAAWSLFKLGREASRERLLALKNDSDSRVAALAGQLAQATGSGQSGKGELFMLTTIEKVIILKSIKIFAETPEAVLAEVAAILNETAKAAGEPLFVKGDMDRSMYIIISGRVRVHDEEQTLAYLGERDIVGELSVLDAEPRSASVTVVEEATLFQLDQSILYELMADHIEVAQGIIRVLTRRIRSLQVQNREALVDGDEERKKKATPSDKALLLREILERLEED